MLARGTLGEAEARQRDKQVQISSGGSTGVARVRTAKVRVPEVQ